MRFRTTLFLLGVVGVLYLVVRWLDREGATTPVKGPEPLLGEFHAALVDRLELELITRESLQLEAKGATWWMVGPIVDHARASNVEALIDVLLQNPRARILERAETQDLTRFGLEPPRGRVTLIGDGGTKRLSLRVGERDPAGSLVYVKIEGEDAVYQTGANLANLLERNRQDWRADRFVTGDGALARRIEMVRPGLPKIVAERKTGIDWTLIEPMVYAGDSGQISQLVNGLLLLDVQNFTEANPSPERRVEKNLDTTATVVTIDFGNRKVELRFGSRQTSEPGSPRFATSSEREHLFVVRGPVLAMLDVSAKDLRDKRISRFSANDVTFVRVTRRDGLPFELTYRAADRRFHFTQPFDEPSDDARGSPFRSFLSGIGTLEARANDGFLDPEEFPPSDSGIDPIAALGFDDPAYVFEIETANATDGGKRMRIEVTDDDGTGFRMVRRADLENSPIWLVAASRLAQLGDSDPRTFLDRRLLPTDLENYERVVFTRGEKRREIHRIGDSTDRIWTDPTDPKVKTHDLQEFLAKLAGLEASRFLPRDAAAEDGLAPPFGTLEIWFSGARVKDPPITLRIGAPDPSGKLVRVASSRLDPLRAVAECEIWLRDDFGSLLP